MNPIRHSPPAVALVATLLLAARTSFAQGYSDLENQNIWQLRLVAQQYASSESGEKCSWNPKSPRTFSDQLIFDENISNKILYITIMSALRLDQNARAISLALRDNQSETKTGEVDEANLITIKKIILNHGFPTVAEVGERGVNAMLLLVAHADEDIEFQKSAASVMKDEITKGKLPEIYLIVLKSIRPNIFQPPNISNKEPVTPHHQASHMSKMDCYNHAYQDFMNLYIRKKFAY